MKAKLFLLLILFVGLANQSYSQSQLNLGKGGLAIEGYDPVAYFLSGKAVKGNKQFSVNDKGALYYFSSSDNLNKFKNNPEKYKPEYGGWCAYAMGNSGEKVKIDPETFKIVEGKLYLFYNFYFTNTLDSWNKDEINLKKRANVNWEKFLKQTK